MVWYTGIAQFTTLLAFIEMRFHTKKNGKKILYFSNINLVGVHEYRPTTKFNEILH